MTTAVAQDKSRQRLVLDQAAIDEAASRSLDEGAVTPG